MKKKTPIRYLTELREWSLPLSEELEDRLLDDMIRKTCLAALRIGSRVHNARKGDLSDDIDKMEDEVCELLAGGSRKVVESLANEWIFYWLKGEVDGNDGKHPELCVEFPYLQRSTKCPPLTIAYCVDNCDGSRTEINRTTLQTVLMRFVEGAERVVLPARAKIIASELRALADKFEKAA